jgi:hypothetical protein
MDMCTVSGKMVQSRGFTMSTQRVKTSSGNYEAWIGLAHVRPQRGNDVLQGAMGAFVAVVALANSEDEFVNQVVKKLNSYDFDVIEIKDIELFRKRSESFNVDQEVSSLVNSLTSKSPIALHKFHSYSDEEP